MKPEYREGREARKKVEEGMSNLFRAPKPATEPSKEAKTKPQREVRIEPLCVRDAAV
jgi:hypothetical protein